MLGCGQFIPEALNLVSRFYGEGPTANGHVRLFGIGTQDGNKISHVSTVAISRYGSSHSSNLIQILRPLANVTSVGS